MLRVTKNKINFKQIFENFLKKEEKSDRGAMQCMYDTLFGECYDENWWNQYEEEKTKRKHGKDSKDIVWCKEIGEFVTREEYDFLQSQEERYKSKRGCRGKKNKRNFVEYDDDFFKRSDKKSKKKSKDTEYSLNKERWIYYYPNYTDKGKKIKLDTLFDLDAYLETNCIETTEADVDFMMKNSTIHCTSIRKADGKKMLVVDKSWGNLVFSVQEMESVVSGIVSSSFD